MAGRYDAYDFSTDQAVPQAPAEMFDTTALKPSKLLTKNPMLSASPLGAYTDSQYESQEAQLRNNISKQYADILQQLGYQDDNGNFIPGTVEAAAQKQAADLQRSQGLAVEGVTQDAQKEGTLFSGLRGINQGRAEHPYVSALSDLATQTPLTLMKLYEQGAGLADDYTLQNNLYLADAAARNAAKFQGSVGTAPAAEAPPAGGGDMGSDPNDPNAAYFAALAARSEGMNQALGLGAYTSAGPTQQGLAMMKPPAPAAPIRSVGQLVKKKGLAAAGGRHF